MIHYLSTIRSDRLGFGQLAALDAAAKPLWSDRLVIDFSRCRFFDANMAAPLSSVLARIADSYNAIEIINVPTGIETILRKNGFLVAYGYTQLPDGNHTTLPIKRTRLSEQGRFADYLELHLRGKGIPRMTPGLEKAFKQSLFEVFQNAVVHSESPFGIFVCGQFYPNDHRLDLTIADAGVGIRSNVRRYLGNKISSVDAIKWALQAGNTTKTGSQPGGIGLKFLKEFVALNRGKIEIVSRYGFYDFNAGIESFAKLDADYIGTAVNFEINTADTQNYCLRSELSPDNVF